MLSDLINKENVILNLESTDKDELFAEMVETVIKIQPSLNRDQVLEAVNKREAMLNTCVKQGIAVPHCSLPDVDKICCVIGISRKGIDYDAKEVLNLKSYDEALVHIVLMFVFDSGNTNEHLQTLASCAHDFQSADFYKQIVNAKSVEEVLNIVREFDEK